MIDRATLELRPLGFSDEQSFLEAVDEFRREQPPWPFALGFDEGMSFADYVRRMEAWVIGQDLPAGYVPGSFLVGVVDGKVVGRVSLRYRLNEFLASVGGHIGYGVIPSQRRRGYATEMLRLALPLCAAVGVERALITCDIDNVGSRKVIERCGGVFESMTNDPTLDVQRRRYWIQTGGASGAGNAPRF